MLDVNDKGNGSVIDIVALVEQPFASVTVTMYVFGHKLVAI